METGALEPFCSAQYAALLRLTEFIHSLSAEIETAAIVNERYALLGRLSMS